MRIRRPVAIGWALLVVAGWGATLWLGEPTATAGPGPAVAPTGPYTDPGPQPEGGPCPVPRATPRATPSPASTSSPPLTPEPGDRRAVLWFCAYAVAR